MIKKQRLSGTPRIATFDVEGPHGEEGPLRRQSWQWAAIVAGKGSVRVVDSSSLVSVVVWVSCIVAVDKGRLLFCKLQRIWRGVCDCSASASLWPARLSVYPVTPATSASSPTRGRPYCGFDTTLSPAAPISRASVWLLGFVTLRVSEASDLSTKYADGPTDSFLRTAAPTTSTVSRPQIVDYSSSHRPYPYPSRRIYLDRKPLLCHQQLSFVQTHSPPRRPQLG